MSRILNQKGEGDALNDAYERELDLDDRRIEVGTAGGKFHARLLSDSDEAVRKNYVPGGIRTPNLLIRSQKLYPVELQALNRF
jgi:hypothetical protein